MDPNSNTSRIFDLLVKGQEADKEAAKEALDDPNQPINRPCLRCMILEALAEKFRPPDDGNQEEDPIVRWTRGWLLNVLARISDDNTKAAKFIRNHLSPEYEHSWKVRYWTLAGLVKAGPDDLENLAQEMAHAEKESSVSLLAKTILASKNDRNSKNKIMEELVKKENKSWELVVRALRFVYVPETVEYLLDIVEDGKNSSATYDAIIALGLVPKTSPCADDVVQKLARFIVKRRHYARYDQMRKQALISLRKLEAASVGPILVEELSDDNPAIVREAARALEKVLGTRIATDRVVEAACKAKHRVRVYANALRWMERRRVVDGLETIMVTGHSAQKEMATTLLSEIGGVEAFQKLQTRAKSMVQHADVLEKAERKIRGTNEITKSRKTNDKH